ncbi:hypothetical protein ABQF33_17310 [Mycolicibacterium sp. XJ2]
MLVDVGLVVAAFVVDGLFAGLGAGLFATRHFQGARLIGVAVGVGCVVDDGGGGGAAQFGKQPPATGVSGVGLALSGGPFDGAVAVLDFAPAGEGFQQVVSAI